MNPIQMLGAMLKAKKNPQEIVSNIMNNNNNPMVKNLSNMAKNGDNQGIENFARNLFKEQGRDFDKEFGAFMDNMKKIK